MYSDQQYPSYPMEQIDSQNAQSRPREPGFIFASNVNSEPGFHVPPQPVQQPSYYTPPPNEQYTEQYSSQPYTRGANDYSTQQNTLGFDYQPPTKEIQSVDNSYNTQIPQEPQESDHYKPQQIEPVPDNTSAKYGYSSTSLTQQQQNSDGGSSQENDEKDSGLWKILCCGICAYTCYECCCWCC